MNFWKNIFNTKNKATKKATRYDTYRKELNELNLKTIADLENLVRPIIRTATKLEISEAKRPPENAQLDSHFGGQP